MATALSAGFAAGLALGAFLFGTVAGVMIFAVMTHELRHYEPPPKLSDEDWYKKMIA